MKHYRDVWVQHHGPIPRDSDGRAYEIHHINKNPKDNSIENLQCVSIKEHYDIHVSAGDVCTAMMIAYRMGKSPEELSAMQMGNKHSARVRKKISATRSISKRPAWNKGKSGYAIKANRGGNRYSSKVSAADVIFMRNLLINKIELKPRRRDSTYLASLAWWLQENHYPYLTIPGIRGILQGKSWKEVKFIPTTDYDILTPGGFQSFGGIRTHAVQGMFKLTLEDGTVLRCTTDHRVQTNRGMVEVGELTYDDLVQTEKELVTIKYLGRETVSEIVYDPVEVSNGNEYYSDGVVSHNCEFISSDAMLIDSLRLSYLKETKPVTENMGFKFWTEHIGGKNKTYLIGLDPATGNGKDFTVIEVVEFPKMEQIAELRLNTVNIPLIYAKLKWLFKFLRQPTFHGRSEIMWSFERNGVGEALVAMIQNDDAMDGGVYLDGVELYSETPNRLGVYTTGKSKLLSCMQLKNLIEKGPTGLKINSDTVLFELQNFVATGGTYAAKAGCTDDCVMALAVIMKVLGRLASYDDSARKMVYESVDPDSDKQNEEDPFADQFGGEAVPWIG